MPLPGLVAAKFPSFYELVGASGTVANEPKPTGLFSAMVGDPDVLYQDLLDNPSRYEEGVSSLLLGLTSGERRISDISKQEMELLDRAVLDLGQPRRDKPKPKPEVAPKRMAARPTPVAQPPKVPGSNTDLPPYWWLQ
jgi:hypothetical protein